MLIVLIFQYSEVMLLLLAVTYVASGPVSRLIQAVRRLPIHGAHQEEHRSLEPHQREP